MLMPVSVCHSLFFPGKGSFFGVTDRHSMIFCSLQILVDKVTLITTLELHTYIFTINIGVRIEKYV
jgi:hypothetical protein